MLSVLQVEAVQQQLLAVSGIVDQQESRSSTFPQAVVEWLKASEDVLKGARLPATGAVAALRSRLLSCIHGNSATDRGRKARHLAASQVLAEAQQLIGEAVEPAAARIREAEEIAYRVVAVARAKGVLHDLSRLEGHQHRVQQLCSALKEDPDTQAAYAHISGLVGRFDALVVLDRATPELD